MSDPIKKWKGNPGVIGLSAEGYRLFRRIYLKRAGAFEDLRREASHNKSGFEEENSALRLSILDRFIRMLDEEMEILGLVDKIHPSRNNPAGIRFKNFLIDYREKLGVLQGKFTVPRKYHEIKILLDEAKERGLNYLENWVTEMDRQIEELPEPQRLRFAYQ